MGLPPIELPRIYGQRGVLMETLGTDSNTFDSASKRDLFRHRGFSFAASERRGRSPQSALEPVVPGIESAESFRDRAHRKSRGANSDK